VGASREERLGPERAEARAPGQPAQSAYSVIGREIELSVLDEILGPEGATRSLVITGEPGIGKTTLWQSGVARARRAGLRVLAAGPSGAEAQLSFAALMDLLDGIEIERMTGIPAPLCRALEVALLRADAAGGQLNAVVPAEPRAISAGLVTVLRALSSVGPVLVAIDDVQWLDSATSDALAFAARRVGDHRVGFLLCRRSGDKTELERALGPAELRALQVSALSLGAIHRLLSVRLGLSLSRRLLRSVYETSRGNPLFALELGRMLADRDGVDDLSELSLPDALDDLFGPRVLEFPRRLRRALLAAALSPGVPRPQLEQVADPFAVADALAEGLLYVDSERVYTAHPLLAAAAVRHSSARSRRDLHFALASVVTGQPLRARHLALASLRPDADVAAVVVAAAATAFDRGARHDAVKLGEQALRLTPEGAPERAGRLLALARYLNSVGALQRMTDLLAPNLDSFSPGLARARAWLLLADGGDVLTTDEVLRRLDLAIAECPADAGVRATVLARKAHVAAAGRVEGIAAAEQWAQDALAAAKDAGPETEWIALGALAWARVLRGRPVTDLTGRFARLPGADLFAADWYSPNPPAATRLIWRGEADAARAMLTGLLSIADEQGDAASRTMLRFVLCDLELRAGQLDAAQHFLNEFGGSDRDVMLSPNYEYSRALLAAERGDPGEADRWVAETLDKAHAAGIGWDRLEASRASGMAALLTGEPDRAAPVLRAVWEHMLDHGVADPGAFPIAPDLVEALAEAGEIGEARAVTGRLREQAEAQEHPWGLATAARCTAVTRLASSYDESAANDLAVAADDFGRLGLAFDRARCLLWLGRAGRRSRRRGLARRCLSEAAVAFDRIGSAGWAERARSELSRIGARQPLPQGELSPAETSVAELAAGGLSNKEIASRLFVSVHTVELHLSHAYAKLGIRSRAQLAARMNSGTGPAPT
jgi:DNA-binding CsgD family transcriptional regulator/tetratricopeptide (TPR) repeat protein